MIKRAMQEMAVANHYLSEARIALLLRNARVKEYFFEQLDQLIKQDT